MIGELEGKAGTPKLPMKLNEHSGKESSLAFAFSDPNWGSATRKFTERVKKRTAAQISTIIEAAHNTSLSLITKRNSSCAMDTATSDAYDNICKSIYVVVT
ncbi:hypothetical protein JVT61DRAFT_14586 [Boletus reticuloceps]|uniref:Uncharacterized protein n=1 Tax=Boletus reticuloceps TaxID=495285 RepID=A0A8I2YWC7_9AGAM|nr:hypothetical protein JVT61DRAFT_14586 [Boletus reticuloceps]